MVASGSDCRKRSGTLGIGVGGKEARSHRAAKVFLAAMLTSQAELGDDADIASFLDIGDFAEESRRVRRVAFPHMVPQGDPRGHGWGGGGGGGEGGEEGEVLQVRQRRCALLLTF